MSLILTCLLSLHLSLTYIVHIWQAGSSAPVPVAEGPSTLAPTPEVGGPPTLTPGKGN